MGERHDRLRKARIDAGFKYASDAAKRFAWNLNTYKSNENGNAPFGFPQAEVYAKAFGVRAEWLYAGNGPMRDDGPALVRIIGRVGADTEGTVIMTTGQEAGDMAPPPPSGSTEDVALEVRGYSMRGLADDGALVYISDQRTPPTPDMLGHVVLVELEDGRVLLKRLLRGSAPGLFDLESIAGPPLHDQRVVWAAHVTAIVPPATARKIIIRQGMVA